MRLLSLIVRPYLRVVLGAIAGCAMIIAGTYAFAPSDSPEPTPSRTRLIFPVIVEPLGSNWTTPSPPR
ncbi:hypothetical protein [Nocardia sp. NPDC004722]